MQNTIIYLQPLYQYDIPHSMALIMYILVTKLANLITTSTIRQGLETQIPIINQFS